MIKKEITFLSNDEYNFAKYINFETKEYWESKVRGKQDQHNYIFEMFGRSFYISFTFRSIICSLIIDMEKQKLRDIYAGYSWEECRKTIELYDRSIKN